MSATRRSIIWAGIRCGLGLGPRPDMTYMGRFTRALESISDDSLHEFSEWAYGDMAQRISNGATSVPPHLQAIWNECNRRRDARASTT